MILCVCLIGQRYSTFRGKADRQAIHSYLSIEFAIQVRRIIEQLSKPSESMSLYTNDLESLVETGHEVRPARDNLAGQALSYSFREYASKARG